MKEKSIPAKIVILAVILLMAGAAIWVSIGASISALPQYSKNNVSGTVLNAANQRIHEANTSCSSLQTCYADIGDFLIVAEDERLLVGDSLSLAWTAFRDRYMGPYLDCRLSHFREKQWGKTDLDNAMTHLGIWERRCPLSSYKQIDTLKKIQEKLQSYNVGAVKYKDKADAKNKITQSRTYKNNVYLKNCTTAEYYANNLRNDLSNSHLNQLEHLTEKLNKPNENFGSDNDAFKDSVKKSTKILWDFKDLVDGKMYAIGDTERSRLKRAEDIINSAKLGN